jgi:hypothetical protein
MKTFKYNVTERGSAGHYVDITVSCKIPPEATAETPAQVLGYVRSMVLKQDLSKEYVAKKFPNYGMSIQGGPRPILEKPDDRGSKLLGYEQDFRLTRGN